MIRAGDIVHPRASPDDQEVWGVACVDGPYLYPNGWPPGRCGLEAVELRRPCSDAEHEAALREWAYRGGDHDERRVICRRQLDRFLSDGMVLTCGMPDGSRWEIPAWVVVSGQPRAAGVPYRIPPYEELVRLAKGLRWDFVSAHASMVTPPPQPDYAAGWRIGQLGLHRAP